MKSMLVLTACLLWQAAAMAQGADPPPRGEPACPPDVKGNPPTIGGAAPNLGEKLSDSKGIICPPAGVDPQIAVPPPPTGDTKVIPPPGSPGGDPHVQPK